MEKQKAQGILLNAVGHKGQAALWEIARGRTPLSEVASEVIELATSPFHTDISLEEAIMLVTGKKKG